MIASDRKKSRKDFRTITCFGGVFIALMGCGLVVLGVKPDTCVAHSGLPVYQWWGIGLAVVGVVMIWIAVFLEDRNGRN